jgi:hypothetical protein
VLLVVAAWQMGPTWQHLLLNMMGPVPLPRQPTRLLLLLMEEGRRGCYP